MKPGTKGLFIILPFALFSLYWFGDLEKLPFTVPSFSFNALGAGDVAHASIFVVSVFLIIFITLLLTVYFHE